MIQLFQFTYKITGTGAVDVTPMCDPSLFILPNCTAEQISLETYENFVLEYDNKVTDACHPAGIHHCGSVNEVLDGYAKVRHLRFVEIGFGSDVRRARKVFGPEVAVNARISPVLMKNGTQEEVAAEVRRLIVEGAPLQNFSIDTVGLTYGTPDENVRIARRTAAEHGEIRPESGAAEEGRRFYGFGEGRTVKETVIRSPSRSVTIGPGRPLTIIGERINPTGRRNLAQALEQGDLRLVQSEAVRQVEAGAHVLDVNVGVSGIDEAKMLKAAIAAVVEVTDVPICIDSALPRALEAGLEVYQGKALVNSVNGETHKLDQVLPLVKEFGAAVIGLTRDDRGIPKKAQDRLEIARRIVERAERLGIPREDVIIDPLAMAVSADHLSAVETLRAFQLIRDELGVNQTLGLSNISFGLPERASINAMFLAMAMLNGLTCPIVDPASWEMRKAMLIADMLLGKDDFCMNYIAAMGEKSGTKAPGKGPSQAARPKADPAALREAVVKGKRTEAVTLTKEMLASGMGPQEIIDTILIPALNVVGEEFESKRIFIPEMMMAAKSMQAGIDVLNPLMAKEAESTLGTVVLGTVFGDLHDIGKNLVKLLLETTGFKVVDLGENVPPDRFVSAARKHRAHIVGLSSLLTTGDPHVEETIRAIRQSDIGERVKTICGGAAVTLKFVEACGADAYAKDAADGVKKCKAMVGAG